MKDEILNTKDEYLKMKDERQDTGNTFFNLSSFIFPFLEYTANRGLCRVALLTLLLFAIFRQTAAQPVCTVTRYNEDAGMSQWHITQMLQDKNGMMWFSTWNGLDRFDGYEFVNFKSHAGDGHSMPNDRMRDMRMDDDGSLCLKTDTSWYVFVPHDGTFRKADAARNNHLNASLKGRGAVGAKARTVEHRDANGYLWTIDASGQLFYQKQGVPPTAYAMEYPLSDIKFFMSDRQHNLWLLTGKEVFKLSFAVRPSTRLPMDSRSQVRAVFIDRKQRYWVATKDDARLRLYDRNNRLLGFVGPDGSLSQHPVAFGASVYCIAQTRDGAFWMGTKPDGLFRLQETAPQRFAVEHLTDAVPCSNIYDLKEDKQGRLWVATMDGGIRCVNDTRHPTTSLALPAVSHEKLSAEANPQTATPRQIRFLHITRENVLLAATTEGLLVGQIPASGDLRQMRFKLHRKEADRPSSLSCNATMDVLETPDHQLFVSTESGGVNEICSTDILADRLDFRHYNQKNGLNSDIALSLTWHDGQIVIVSSNQLMTLRPGSDSFGFYNASFFHEPFQFSECHPQQLPDGRWVFGLMDGGISLSPDFFRKSNYVPPIVLTGIDTPGTSTTLRPSPDLRSFTLQPRERSLTVYFAALDYENPEAISYAYKLADDSVWNYIGHNRVASFANLKPCNYELQLRSTNADGVWVDNVRALTIVVRPTFLEAWYGQLLMWLLAMALVGAALYTYFYVRRIKRQQHDTLEKYLALVSAQSGPFTAPSSSSDNAPHSVAEGTTNTSYTDNTAGRTIEASSVAVGGASAGTTGETFSGTEVGPSLARTQVGTSGGGTPLKREDEAFMARVMAFVEAHIGDADVNMGDMADATATSRSGLNRKMKTLVGLTPADFLREARLKRAARLLLDTADPVSDIAYRCGFTDPKYFGKCFKTSMGVSPTEYRSGREG